MTPPERPIRVLLVDDHPALRAGLRQALEADPAISVVAEAGDGAEALSLVYDFQPDVVVLDVDLPILTGVEVARALKGSRTRVLAYSAHAGRGFVRGILDAGAAGYLTKDRGPDALVAAVKAVAAGEGRWFVVPNPDDDPVLLLSDRERNVLSLLARGLSNATIAERLFLSASTVSNALTTVYLKIGVTNAREAVSWAWANDLGPNTPS